MPCVSLSLNIPGFPKSNSTAKLFFQLCLDDLKRRFKIYNIDILDVNEIRIIDAAGDFSLIPFRKGAISLQEVKQICEAFEESHPLGRFVDVDLNDENGDTISSGKSKLCFFCHARPAAECRRRNSHDTGQVRSFMFEKMAEYCLQQRENELVTRISILATRAILREISLTPKPGLVDKFSNGSHSDMSYQTFIDSSAAISGWFGEMIRAGFHYHEADLSRALPVIRDIGLRMESAMFGVTKNVNTQKGIIFLFGLSLFACGKIYSQAERFEPDLFRTIIKDICKDMVSKELGSFETASSHGEKMYHQYGLSGARGEAESGFNTVFEYGLPRLESTSEVDDNRLIKCFLAIASRNNDTNVVFRSDPEVLAAFQESCRIALEDFNDVNYSRVIEFCKTENISPGGSADLLAVTILVWLIRSEGRTRIALTLNEQQ